VNILFVCSANISRSFLAKVLFEDEMRRRGKNTVSAASAGLHAYPGAPPDPKMTAFLIAKGVPWEPHRARRISREDMEKADLILVMEGVQERLLKECFPEAEIKIMRLGRFISPDGREDDIIDPFGKSTYHYRLAQSQITLAVKNLCEELASGRLPHPDAHNKNHSG